MNPKQDSDAEKIKRANAYTLEVTREVLDISPVDVKCAWLDGYEAGRASMRAEILKNIESIFTKNILRGEDWNLCLTCDQVMNVLKMESKND